MSISNLKWAKDSNEVSWKDDNSAEIVRRYREPVQSVTILNDRSGVIIVGSFKELGPQNAVIINNDGSERLRLPRLSSFPYGSVYGYYYAYYEGLELKAIISTTSGDSMVTVDPQTGALSDVHETR